MADGSGYFLVRLNGTPAQLTAHALQEKDGAYLSPNGRIAASANAARLARRDVAELCIELWRARLEARYGEQLTLQCEHWSGPAAPERVASDAAVELVARARSRCWASNQRVSDAARLAARAELDALAGPTP